MIQIKDIDTLISLTEHPLHEDMKRLLRWLDTRQRAIVITCAYEKRDYPSVHSTMPVRGVDIRSRVYTRPQAVVDDINKHWIYNPDIPESEALSTQKYCAMYHDAGRGPHIHLQVHDNTLLR